MLLAVPPFGTSLTVSSVSSSKFLSTTDMLALAIFDSRRTCALKASRYCRPTEATVAVLVLVVLLLVLVP